MYTNNLRRFGRWIGLALATIGVFITGAGVASPATAGATSNMVAGAVSSTMALGATVPTSMVSPSVGTLHREARLPLRQSTVTTLWTRQGGVSVGQTVNLVGSTLAGPGRTRVTAQTLRLQVSTATGWKTIASRALSARGYATFTVRPVRSTTYRVLFAETDRLVGSRSAAKRIDVRAAAPAPRTSGGSTSAAAPSLAAAPSSAVARVLAVAAAQTGKWYRYGAAGPNYFDCSGFTQYVFKHVGIYLPHKANSQKYYGRAVSRSAARPGDLVVFLSGGYGYHVGIYAGGGYMYDAPYSGKQVGKRKIWGTNVIFRRLL